MINRIIIALASILSSGVLAYAHLLKYWEIKTEKETPFSVNIHINTTLPVLDDTVVLVFGLLFLTLFFASLVFAIKGKTKTTFACFVGVMLLIWIRLWAGAR
jgi:hypothetical protein